MTGPRREARPAYRLVEVDWPGRAAAIRQVRTAVFILEQAVPEALEWDEWDCHSRHLLAVDPAGEPVATGRLSPAGRIGRMAVLSDWRGRGLGSALLERLLAMAREEGNGEAVLHAQCHALGFYGKHGFTARGPEFLEAGIRHREMVRTL